MFTKDTSYERAKEELEKRELYKKAEEENLRTCFEQATKTKEGKCAFKYIKKISCWDTEELNVESSVLAYQRGRRDAWLLIRQFLPKQVLADIEIYDKYDIKVEIQQG